MNEMFMCRRHLPLLLLCGVASNGHRFALDFRVLVAARILEARVHFAFSIEDFIESGDSTETSTALSGCWFRVRF